MVDQINGNGNETDGQSHINVPVPTAFRDAFKVAVSEARMPIGSEDGALDMPTQAYWLMSVLIDTGRVEYVLLDADRTSGRQPLSDDERKLKAALGNASSRAAMLAALKAAGITF